MLRVCFLTDGLHPWVVGGMQRHSTNMITHLAHQGVELDVYHRHPSSSLNPEPMEIFGAEVMQRVRLTSVEWPGPFRIPGHYLLESWLYSRRVACAAQSAEHADFVYAKGFTATEWLRRRPAGSPPVGVNFHGYEMFQRTASAREQVQQWMLRPLVRYSARRADWLFSYGGRITDLAASAGGSRSKVVEIPGAISRDQIAAQPTRNNQPRRFVFLGRYERRKGVEELTAALAQLPKSPAFRFDFIGPIPRTLRSARNEVFYHGTIVEPGRLRELLQSADVLVAPSFSEGMPNVVLEAMACGLATLTTDVGALPLVVGPDNGWMIPPGNVSALRAALQEVLRLPDERLTAMKWRSLHRVRESFTWETVAHRTVRAMEAILAGQWPEVAAD